MATAEYGDVTATALQNFTSGFGYGFATLGLVLVGATALGVVVLSSQRWVRLIAVGIPVLMLLGMLAVTPAALGNKLESQYDATPQCWWEEDSGVGPGMEAARVLAGIRLDRARRLLQWCQRRGCRWLRRTPRGPRRRRRRAALPDDVARRRAAGGCR